MILTLAWRSRSLSPVPVIEFIPRGQSQRASLEVFNQVIARMEGGESAMAVLRELKVNRGSFWKWLHHRATPSMLQRYRNAVQARAHAMVDETVDIADQATGPADIGQKPFNAGICLPAGKPW
jgi:hypothetical protein